MGSAPSAFPQRRAEGFQEAERLGRAAGTARLRALTPADGIRELAAMAALAERMAPLADPGVRRARDEAHARKRAALERAARALRSLRR